MEKLFAKVYLYKFGCHSKCKFIIPVNLNFSSVISLFFFLSEPHFISVKVHLFDTVQLSMAQEYLRIMGNVGIWKRRM